MNNNNSDRLLSNNDGEIVLENTYFNNLFLIENKKIENKEIKNTEMENKEIKNTEMENKEMENKEMENKENINEVLMNKLPECLVLKIEEIDYENLEIDNTIYIFYNAHLDSYVLRGKRKVFSLNNLNNKKPYSFNCINVRNLVDFLTFVICKKNLWTYTVYNYDKLYQNQKQNTFDFLNKSMDKRYEIAGYDNAKFDKMQLKSNLKLLKNMYNLD
jgi:hypothetical protein